MILIKSFTIDIFDEKRFIDNDLFVARLAGLMAIELYPVEIADIDAVLDETIGAVLDETIGEDTVLIRRRT